MPDTKHALQLPLRADDGDTTKAILWDRSGERRVEVEAPSFEREAIRDFIARACNTHDEAREALRDVIRVADRRTVEFDRARAILAKMDGKA